MIQIAFLVFLLTAAYAPAWSYNDTTSWDSIGFCGGSRQSPIDIVTESLTPRKLLPLTSKYCPLHAASTISVNNNGHAFQLNFPDLGDDCDTIAIGAKTYKLAQMHFHRHADFNVLNLGSEHSIDGVTYPSELHAVHYDIAYPNLTAAVLSGQGDALAVIGFMFSEASDTDITSDFHGFFEIVSKFPNMAAGETIMLQFPISLDLVLPKEVPCYAHYEGSLTTPTCNEVVQWYVSSEIYSIPANFMDFLRKLNNTKGEVMSHNWRPVQPLNNRSVYTPEGCFFSTPNGLVEKEESEDDHRVLVIATLILVVLALLIAIYGVFIRSPPKPVPSLQGSTEARFHNLS